MDRDDIEEILAQQDIGDSQNPVLDDPPGTLTCIKCSTFIRYATADADKIHKFVEIHKKHNEED